MKYAAVFFFLAAASIALFSFLIAVHWIDTRAAERRARDRLALLRKIADQPTESTRMLIDLVREEDARAELQEQQRKVQARLDELKGGLILMATGLGVAIMLAAIVPQRNLWTIGLIPALVGLVVFTFAYFSRSRDRRAEA